MLFEFTEVLEQRAKMKVVGIGGAGGNALNRMIRSGLEGVDFVAINTDAQALDHSDAKTKIQIGQGVTVVSQEHLLSSNMLLHSKKPLTNVGAQPCFCKRDPPVRYVVGEVLLRSSAVGEDKVV